MVLRQEGVRWSPGGSWHLGAAVVLSVAALLWWASAGGATEDFGSDCVRYFGETGPRAGYCDAVNHAARDWLPRLVLAQWAATALIFWVPRHRRGARLALLGAVAGCLAAAVALVAHAMAVSRP